MKPLSDIYKNSFFGKRNKLQWRVNPLCSALIKTFKLIPGDSVVDFGCGIGDFVAGLKERGIDSCGIEGSKEAAPFFVSHDISIFDLRMPLPFRGINKFKLAYSLEVAEHIEPEFTGIYIENLCNASDSILISAAGPGQKGHYHVNCQPKEYWEDLFKQKGFKRSFEKEEIFRNELKDFKKKKGLSGYYNNVLIFERGEND